MHVPAQSALHLEDERVGDAPQQGGGRGERALDVLDDGRHLALPLGLGRAEQLRVPAAPAPAATVAATSGETLGAAAPNP